MSNRQLTPEYLDIDFLTLKDRLKDQIKNNTNFIDVDYEGSNITTLIELMCYIGELNTYYLNKIAKNMYLETSTVYENVHKLSKLRGYEPKGPISGETALTINFDLTSSNVNAGDTVSIPAWFALDTGETTDDDESIKYSTIQNEIIEIPTTASGTYEATITLKQGEYEIFSIEGENLIDNKYTFHGDDYDYGIYPYTNPSIQVYVEGTKWERIENVYDDVSGLPTTDNVYKFAFNKDKNAYLEFFDSRNVPNITDNIEIILLKTHGKEGDIGSGKITNFENQTIPKINQLNNRIDEITNHPFIENGKTSLTLDDGISSITNTTSLYEADAETITELKDGADYSLYTQKRTVTKKDYKEKIENGSSVEKVNVWGEKEENPGNTNYYYKIYISIIPVNWSTTTVLTSAGVDWTDGNNTEDINVPTSYDSDYTSDIQTFIEPYRFINTQEIFVVPELVYFRFDMGIKVKRTYSFSSVSTTVKDKLIYYFDQSNRDFGETIDFKEIHNYILDTDEYSNSNYFSEVKGINNLIIRDIETWTPSLSGGSGVKNVYDYNTDGNYPMYDDISLEADYNNNLKPIVLGYNQFPTLASNICSFINEG